MRTHADQAPIARRLNAACVRWFGKPIGAASARRRNRLARRNRRNSTNVGRAPKEIQMTQALLGLPPETVRDIGWTLLHFLWQGFVLAALLHMILPMCRSAGARHNWSLGTLAMMAFAPVVTFLFLHSHADAARSIAFATASPSTDSVIRVLSPTLIPSLWIDWLVIIWLAG